MGVIFNITAICVCSIGTISSAFVLFILWKADHGRQHFIMDVMIFSCVLHDIGFVLLWSVNLHDGAMTTQHEIVRRILFIVCTGIYQVFVFTLAVMTMDRHIAFNQPFQYHRVVTRTRLYFYYVFVLLIVVSTRILFMVKAELSMNILYRIDIVQETILLVPQPFLYWRIYKQWKDRVHRQKQSSRDYFKRRQREQKQFLLISLIICLTCLGQVISDVTYILYELSTSNPTSSVYNKEVMEYISYSSWILVVFLTPLCHVVVRPSVKRYVQSLRLSRKDHSTMRHSSIELKSIKS